MIKTGDQSDELNIRFNRSKNTKHCWYERMNTFKGQFPSHRLLVDEKSHQLSNQK